MKKTTRIISLLLAAIFIAASFSGAVEVKALTIAEEEVSFTPAVYGEITSQTKKVKVYSYADDNTYATLTVKNGSKTIFKSKKYKEAGLRVIDIPRQKAGSVLSFTLTTSNGKKGKTVKKKVKDVGTVSNKKVTSLSKPKVSGKLTDKSTSVKVYAKKGTTLFVKYGSKTIAKKKYKTSGYQTLAIKKQKAGETITFFVENKKGRSKYVEKTVADKTAPAKPEVSVDAEYGRIKVTGEKGTAVYVKDMTEGEDESDWILTEVLDKKTQEIDVNFYLYSMDTEGMAERCKVRLVDAWGNKSKSVTVNMR